MKKDFSGPVVSLLQAIPDSDADGYCMKKSYVYDK